jgi:surfactin synthase thioesterase subunit
MGDGHRFRLTVLGRYQTQQGSEMAVTVNVLAGRNDHLVHSGTLTMSESEWATFTDALKASLGDDVEIEDRSRRI